MSRTALYLGRGLGWPVRMDSRTGGFQITEGQFDSVSVALSYISEQWTIKGYNFKETANNIAEAIYNILLTNPNEHETLPWYFSKMQVAIFEPNTVEFQLLYAVYLSHASARWEKRAQIPQGAIQWGGYGLITDRGEAPLTASVQFITQQTPKNLVLPFVTERQSRIQEYPASVIDVNGCDLPSRYYNQSTYFTQDSYSYLRLRNQQILVPPAPDDIYYTVKPLDTWMLIAWALYGEIRYWYYPFLAYMQDNTGEAATRDSMSPDIDPTPGSLIRAPSTSRILILQSRRGS